MPRSTYTSLPYGVIGCVETQGHVLRASDFVATLVLEATVHHLDLTGVRHFEDKVGAATGRQRLHRAADLDLLSPVVLEEFQRLLGRA